MHGQPKNQSVASPSLEVTGSSSDATLSQLAGDKPAQPDTPHTTLTPGTMVAQRYRVINLLGRGGMGEVYRADDLTLNTPVALKFFPAWLRRSQRRLDLFRAEVRLARRVSHPNVCRVHDIGEAEGRLFLSMELVEGEDLTSLLRRIGRLPYEKAMEIARQLCSALSALHDQGLVHRDLKPANVLIDRSGRPKIADFGLAVAGDQPPEAEVAGTPAYMSPEQLRGRPATARSDIYALGLVLYELFTGVRAHDAHTPEEVRRLADSGSTPGRLSDLLDHPEHDLDEAVSRCLQPDPQDRPASALAVLALLPGGDPLRAVLEAQQTPSPELVAASGPRIRLSPVIAALLLAGALACLPIETLIKYAHGNFQAVNPEKSPEVLVDRAQTILRSLGYTDAPRDRFTLPAFRPATAVAALKTVVPDSPLGTRPADAAMRDLLSRRHPATFRILYTESPRFLQIPEELTSPDSPVTDEPGSVSIAVTHAGDLLMLRSIPPRQLSIAAGSPPVTDQDLLVLAGVDPAAFRPATPDFVLAGVASDSRAAWAGTYPGLPDFPVRAEIARLNGRVVSFEILRDSSPAAPTQAPPTVLSGASAVSAAHGAYAASFVLVTIGGIVLAYLQWRSGRGDIRGARRLAGAVFALTMFHWLLRTHHVPSVWQELNPFESGLGTAAEYALVAFALYLAAEPVIRRHAPTLMVSWSRVLAGRWRDGAVGRDVLTGLCFASLYKLSELAFKTDWTDPFRPGSGLRSGASARAMASVPYTLGSTARDTVESIVDASITLLGAVLIIRLCRWRPLGIVAATALLALSSRFVFGGGDGLSAHLASVVFAILAMIAALRFGLLTLIVSFAAAMILNATPATLNPSAWYFPAFAADALIIAGTAAIAFRLAISPPRARASIVRA